MHTALGQRPAAANAAAQRPRSTRGPLLPRRGAGAARGARAAPARAVSGKSGSMAEMSLQMREVRSRMEKDEQLGALMAGFRGTNLSDADFAQSDTSMRFMEVEGDSTDQLPLVYDPAAISAYWGVRPVSVVRRIVQLMSIAGSFLTGLAVDLATGSVKQNEVKRAIELREIVTSLGPAYIKLGQALSIRPDLLSPAAMAELQKLCDKVPSFDSAIAMQVVNDELGAPWYEIFAELTPEPIAAASLGQVYKGRLKTGEQVAVKVQRPGVLETVTIDLYIIRNLGMFMRRFPQITTDVVALLDEWAARFFEELDYVREGENATRFAAQMAKDLPQVVVPRTYSSYTSRRVLTTEWLDGEKLSQSKADDVGQLVNVGVICYLKQLLDTGFFHADPHPGNLIRTPDGRLAILDFGLMTEVDDGIKYGMIEAISHLIHRDYDAIVLDFVTLQFIPEGTDLRPILPVLAKVFDAALEGGGAKNINFQELAADLAQITFDYPFRIPPYFALIIRAIGVLEGIALVGDPDFAIVDEAYPYIAKRLLTDDSPRLQEALRYMVYGKEKVFDADRLIDLLNAFESFTVAADSARGDMDPAAPGSYRGAAPGAGAPQAAPGGAGGAGALGGWPAGLPAPPPFVAAPLAALLGPSDGAVAPGALGWLLGGAAAPAGSSSGSGGGSGGGGGGGPELFGDGIGLFGLPANRFDVRQGSGALDRQGRLREALRFVFSQDGALFRAFIMDELVKCIDALSREQLALLAVSLGLGGARLPVLLPGAAVASIPLAPPVSDEDRKVVENLVKIVNFLAKGGDAAAGGANGGAFGGGAFGGGEVAAELLPYVPAVAREVLPQLAAQLVSRVSARAIREVFVGPRAA